MYVVDKRMKLSYIILFETVTFTKKFLQNCNYVFSAVPAYCVCAHVVYPIFPDFQVGNVHLSLV